MHDEPILRMFGLYREEAAKIGRILDPQSSLDAYRLLNPGR